MRRDPSHSSGMVEEISATCRASMGLAFKASVDPKHAGGDPPRPPRRTKRRRSLLPRRSKFRLFHPRNAFSSSRAFRRICIVWVNQAILSKCHKPGGPDRRGSPFHVAQTIHHTGENSSPRNKGRLGGTLGELPTAGCAVCADKSQCPPRLSYIRFKA